MTARKNSVSSHQSSRLIHNNSIGGNGAGGGAVSERGNLRNQSPQKLMPQFNESIGSDLGYQLGQRINQIRGSL